MSGLTQKETQRYSRQLLLASFGIHNQVKLKNAKVLLIGAGGLGCPAGLYLTSSGVGTIGFLDHDVVALDNIHRQVLHPESRIGQPKTNSAIESCKSINSDVKFISHQEILTSNNALSIIKDYDLVLDCSDNAPTRYLINDTCVLSGKPLISGSALGFEGQLTVYNYDGGPCYRCMFPEPPPPNMVSNCSDAGVMPPITGMVGSMQAMEAIKIICGIGASYSKRMVLIDLFSGAIRTIKLRERCPTCVACGDKPSLTSLIDYEKFCGSMACDKSPGLKLLSPNERMAPKDAAETSPDKTLIIDVRPSHHFDICHIPNSKNIPLKDLSCEEVLKHSPDPSSTDVLFVCRRGNDSQRAVQLLKTSNNASIFKSIKDIEGGLVFWHQTVDPTFCIY